jgi:Bacterial regulatory proteins, gntR family
MSGMSRQGSEWWKSESSQLKLRSAPEAAAQAIRNSIMSGRLKPGDRIIEQQWASFPGIGQPTLREALKESRIPGYGIEELLPRDVRHAVANRL